MLEDYPEDPRGHSHLILGFAGGRPVHVVCAVHEQTLVVITIYRPSPERWDKHRIRKGKKK